MRAALPRCFTPLPRIFAGKRLGFPARLRAEEGGSTVEFAISAVIMLTMMLGTIQMSLALYSYHMISEYAREGTRYAIVHGNACVAGGSSCTATATQVQSHVQAFSYPGIDSTQMTVAVSYSAYPSGTCSPNTNCENPGNLVTVRITYPFLLSVPFVPQSTISMTSTSAMVISQ